MPASPFGTAHLSGGHGPPTYGGAGAQFSDMADDLAKLDIDDKKGKSDRPQKDESTRRVASSTSKNHTTYRERYTFIKVDTWQVADLVRIAAPQKELHQTVAGVKKRSVGDALDVMSADRRKQIDRLLRQKNSKIQDRNAEWEPVFITTSPAKPRKVDGKTIIGYDKMHVIIAQKIPPSSSAFSSKGSSKPFVGERSDIREPLTQKTAGEVKDKPKSPDNKSGPFVPPQQFEQADQHFMPPLTHNSPPIDTPFNRHPHPAPASQAQPGIQFVDDGFLQQQYPGNGHPQQLPQQSYEQMPQQSYEQMPQQSYEQMPQQLPHQSYQQMPQQLPQQSYQQMPQQLSPAFRQSRPEQFNAVLQPRRPTLVTQEQPVDRRHWSSRFEDENSSLGSPDENSYWEDDERSSNTSFGEEAIPHRGSLSHPPRPSVRQREPAYREHRRGSNISSNPPSRLLLQDPRRERRHHQGERGQITIERRPRRSSSRERARAVRYERPARRLEHDHHTPPLTPISNHSSPSSRRYSGLMYPHELERNERFAEDHINGRRANERYWPS